MKPQEDQLVTSIKKRHVKFSTEAPVKSKDRDFERKMETFKHSSTPKVRENVYINRSAYYEHQKLKSKHKFDPLQEFQYLKNRSSKHEKRRALTRNEIKEYYSERDPIEESNANNKLEERNKVLSMVVNSMARTGNVGLPRDQETSLARNHSPETRKTKQMRTID